MKLAKIIKRIAAKEQPEGTGAVVRRYIGNKELRGFDPFLLIDYFKLRLPGGFEDHPHRGFQTLTFLHSGQILHEDFKGNKGVLNPNGIQWMVAGKGIVHAEMPGRSDVDSTGIQLWINLPAKDKMIEPYYIDKREDQIPILKKEGVQARVLSGEVCGQKGCINEFRTPVDYIDFELKKGTNFEQNLKVGWNTFTLVYKGALKVQDEEVKEGEAVFFEKIDEGEAVVKYQAESDCRFVWIAGVPLN